MKMDFGAKTWLCPMPVLLVATYGEDGTPDVMTAAWGGTGSEDLLTLCIDTGHKTWANLLARRAFTVSVGTEAQMRLCDHVGCVSANADPDKVFKTGWHLTKATHVDAPTIDELPLVFECELVSADPDTCLVIGRVVNTAVDEAVLTDGKPDADKLRPLAFDPFRGAYRGLSPVLAPAFRG